MRDFSPDLAQLDNTLAEAAREFCAQGRTTHAGVLERLRRLYVVMRFLVERRGVTTAPSGVQILYAKMAESVEAVRCLLFNGFPGPAGSVVRSMFEATIHLHLIMEKDEEVVTSRRADRHS